MAELKPVPAGYDSSALSSMIGYLANARKQHDNNPMMRVLLDNQARDNLDSYLADADLTRGQQMHDNEAVQALNMAALLQKDRSERAGRAVDVAKQFNVVTNPLGNDQGMPGTDLPDMASLIGAAQENQMLQPDKTRAGIANTRMDTQSKGMGIIKDQVDVGELQGGDIRMPPTNVRPDPSKMPANMRAQMAADALKQTTKEGESGTFNQAFILDENGEQVFLSDAQARQAQSEGKTVHYAERRMNKEASQTHISKTPQGQSKPNVASIVTDMEEAKKALESDPNLQGGTLGQDDRGAYVMKDGKRYRIQKN